MLEEPLIFEVGGTATTWVDVDEARVPAKAGIQSGLPPLREPKLGGLARTAPIGLPGLSEPETVRHYTRLSRQNYAIDLGLFPLCSCTRSEERRVGKECVRRGRSRWTAFALKNNKS